MPESPSPRRTARSAATDRGRAEGFAQFLRQETTGGKLLLAATVVAVVWANLAEDSYRTFWATRTELAPAWLHLDITLEDWAADGGGRLPRAVPLRLELACAN